MCDPELFRIVEIYDEVPVDDISITVVCAVRWTYQYIVTVHSTTCSVSMALRRTF